METNFGKLCVPQGSVLKSNAKLFADDISLFTIIKDENESANVLYNDLSLISEWAFNWKMLFNPDPTKQAQEVLFSRKKKTLNHPTLSLNNIQVKGASSQKHLVLILDEKLNFKQHIESAIVKINKGVAAIKNLDIVSHVNHLLQYTKLF